MDANLFIILWFVILVMNIVFWKFIAWKFIYRENPKYYREQFNEIQIKSPGLFTENCGGKIGRMNFSIGTLTVTVNSEAILLNPLFLGKGFLYFQEIDSITPMKGVLKKRIKITHHSPRINSPIILFTDFNDSLRNMILS